MSIPDYQSLMLPVLGSGAIRDFFGSLDRHKATKGLFVTTSIFSPSAIETTQDLSKRIVLIDGEQLAKLIIRHNVRCRVEDTLQIKKIDEDIFRLDGCRCWSTAPSHIKLATFLQKHGALFRHAFFALGHRQSFLAQILGDLHRAKLRPAHRAEMRGFMRLFRHALIVLAVSHIGFETNANFSLLMP